MQGEDVELTARHQHADEKSPYERLLGDAIRGDAGLFTSDAPVEAAWRVVDPVLRDPAPGHNYEPGPRCPTSAAAMLERQGGGHAPQPRDARADQDTQPP